MGFAINTFARQIGLNLLPWQEWLNIHAFELNPDGSFRYQVLVLLVARQNGKSTWAKVVTLFFMLILKVPMVIGTAQDLQVAEELWSDVVDMLEDDPELDQLVTKVSKAAGKTALEVCPDPDGPKPHRSRYLVKAATRRAGRGLTGDLILLDELREHTKWDAWSAVTKTTMTRENAVVIGLSNAGDASSVVLSYLRKQAHEALGDPDGICARAAARDALEHAEEISADDDDVDWDLLMDQEADSVGLFEWSAAPGRSRFDRDGWAEANPSLNHTTPDHPKGVITERKIAGYAKTDPEWEFRTEVLCQWMDSGMKSPFPDDTWVESLDPDSSFPDERYWVGVDVSSDRTWASIAVAGWRSDGLVHGEVVARAVGVEWTINWLAERKQQILGIAGQTRGAPVSGLMDDIAAAGLPVVDWAGEDLAIGTGMLFSAVKDGDFKHRPQPDLDRCIPTAATKKSGDSGFLWDRAASSLDISPLVAVNAAVWLLMRPHESSQSAYELYDLAIV